MAREALKPTLSAYDYAKQEGIIKPDPNAEAVQHGHANLWSAAVGKALMVDRQTEIEEEELPGLRWLDEQLGIDQTREMGDIVMMAMARDREERGSIKDRRSYAAMDRALARSQGSARRADEDD